MATLYASPFTRPQTLRRIEPTLLQEFLAHYRGFLEGRGIALQTDLNLDEISGVLMDPGPDTPRELIDALFCIKEMSVTSATEALLDEAQRLGISVAADISQPEIALRVWMADREALLRRHAELAMNRVRSFEYFSSVEEDEAEVPSDQTLESLERSLDIFFQDRGHGTGTRIHVYPRGHEMWFLIRHGDLFRREATLENGQSGSVAFRPEKYDLVVFNQLTNELGINAKTEKIRNEYRRQFGFYLFGRENQFAGTSKYSLEPLRELGELSLNVIDVPGIQWVKLALLEWTVQTSDFDVTTRRSVDLFARFRQQQFQIGPHFNLKKATFKVRFDDNPTPRSVTIKPSNVALYSRDEDAGVVEEWFTRRGFIIQGQVGGSEQQELRIPML